ncbi:hypothetical protein [Alteribacillus iranensis]|uniref:Uncharacterized protein n=1 Tax=Alteribacillus iranensis TaxID=930128 RepID=A0A1I2EAR8_9BACI|nr:hypothetical protein [Alteribacillus iranensis]SFE89340.1 hypothetical protein SAMN05192532_105195 [Alteribacillus iranensis]
MGETLINSLTDWLRLFCTFLAFAVPYAVFKINKKLHDFGDPPWKRSEETSMGETRAEREN